MRRNKRTRNYFRSNFYFKATGITLVVAALGILYVWQNVQSVRIGFRIKQKERSIKELQKKMHTLEVTLARLKMPHMIKKRLQEYSIDLSVPNSWQIIRVPKVPLYSENFYDISSVDSVYDESLIGKTVINIAEKYESS